MSEFDEVITAIQQALSCEGKPFMAEDVVSHPTYGYDTETSLQLFVQNVATLANRRMDFKAFSTAEHFHRTFAQLGSAIVASSSSTHGSGPGWDR